MARARSPDRDKAFELWRDSGGTSKLKDIANMLHVSDARIRKWKAEDKWDKKIKERSDSNKGAFLKSKRSVPKRGAPFGNKNAVGNKGGPGGPPGNKNAVTTGEYETIWFDCLDEDEQALCGQINTDHRVQLEEEIQLITIREHRMMKRIQGLVNGPSEKQRRVMQERQVTKEPVTINDDRTGETKTIVVPVPSMVIKSVEEIEYRKSEDILKHEEALTRVQDKKIRQLKLKHDIEYDNAVLAIREKELETKDW